MSDLLLRLAQAHRKKVEEESKANPGQEVKPLFETSGTLASRAKPRSAPVKATDVLDAHKHELTCVVLASQKPRSDKLKDMSELAVVVTGVRDNGSPVLTVNPETNNAYLLATCREPAPTTGPKVRRPRYIAPECALARVSGVLRILVNNARNGPKPNTDFKPEDAPVGTKIQLSGVILNYKMGAPSVDKPVPSPNLYFEADRLEILSKPSFPTEVNNAAINAVISDSPTALYQSALLVDSEMGSANTDLVEIANKDRLFLADFLEELTTQYNGHKIGVGETFERFLIDPDDSAKSIAEAVTLLRDVAGNVVSDALFVLPLEATSLKCNLFVQHAPSLQFAKLMGIHGTGHGTLCTIRKPEFDPTGMASSTRSGLAVGEMTLLPRDERDPKKETSPTMPVKFDMYNEIATRSASTDDWSFQAPRVDDKMMSLHMPIITTKTMKDDVGLMDIDRIHMVALEIVPNCNFVFFPSCIVERQTSTFEMAVQAPDSEWGTYRYIFDVVGGIKNVGVKVTKEFVKEMLCDQDDEFVKPAVECFDISKHNHGSVAMQRPFPTLEKAGYECLNSGRIDRPFNNHLKRLPENSQGVDFYVVFPGVSALHSGDTSFHVNEATGDALMRSKFPTVELLKEFVLNTAAVYGVAKSKKRSREEDQAKPEGTSSDESAVVA